MTALKKYARLEATGLWRASPEAQRRDVIVSIGDATLVVTDPTDRPVTHWSLAAIVRANPGGLPAIFHPDGDPDETLELSADEAEMIAAIEKLRRAVERARPRPGRLRGLGLAVSLAAITALALFWLPGAMLDHTLRVVPDVKRVEIGTDLLRRLERVSGPACKDPTGRRALARLGTRLGGPALVVLPALTRPALNLPGGLIVLDRSVIEDYEEPDVAAGYVLAEMTRRADKDPLRDLLEHAGVWENFHLLTTGTVAPEALDAYAETLLARPEPPIPEEPLLALFEAAELRSTPYAQARDITGETVLALIEADPMTGRATTPLLSDSDWLRLQGICGG